MKYSIPYKELKSTIWRGSNCSVQRKHRIPKKAFFDIFTKIYKMGPKNVTAVYIKQHNTKHINSIIKKKKNMQTLLHTLQSSADFISLRAALSFFPGLFLPLAFFPSTSPTKLLFPFIFCCDCANWDVRSLVGKLDTLLCFLLVLVEIPFVKFKLPLSEGQDRSTPSKLRSAVELHELFSSL